MRLGTVVGRVTLSRVTDDLQGARWLLVSPFGQDRLARSTAPFTGPGSEPTLVVYDDLGAGLGDTIGFVEGREAAQPLDPPAAIDAINAALVDHVFYRAPAGGP
jgi:microcompartment protein CcmK/EutM